MKFLKRIVFVVSFLVSIYMALGGIANILIYEKIDAAKQLPPDRVETDLSVETPKKYETDTLKLDESVLVKDTLLQQKENEQNAVVTFYNVEEQKANDEEMKMLKFFPFYNWFGTTISYLFTLMAFGVLGANIRILIKSLKNESGYAYKNLYAALGLGCIMGLLTVIVSEVLPEFKLVSGKAKVGYTMALVGGMFTLEVFEWLKEKFLTFTKRKKTTSPAKNSS